MPPATRASKQSSPEPTASSSAIQSGAADVEAKFRPREGSRSRTREPREDVYDPKYAVDLATTTVEENVFLFIPNLIGYARVILAAVSLTVMPYHPIRCTIAYFISCILDAVDGQMARKFGQTSKFGAVLDMVTDRCTTACLLCFLSKTYPEYALLFMFLITLDFSSHYMHMYSSLVTGSASHKAVTSDVSRILWYYYNDSRTLFAFCFANETFFVCLYLNAFIHNPIYSAWPVTLVFPRAPLYVHSLHGVTGVVVRAVGGLTWPQLVGLLTFPMWFGKQVINGVQFWKASKILVGVDLAERQAAREAAVAKARGE